MTTKSERERRATSLDGVPQISTADCQLLAVDYFPSPDVVRRLDAHVARSAAAIRAAHFREQGLLTEEQARARQSAAKPTPLEELLTRRE